MKRMSNSQLQYYRCCSVLRSSFPLLWSGGAGWCYSYETEQRGCLLVVNECTTSVETYAPAADDETLDDQGQPARPCIHVKAKVIPLSVWLAGL